MSAGRFSTLAFLDGTVQQQASATVFSGVEAVAAAGDGGGGGSASRRARRATEAAIGNHAGHVVARKSSIGVPKQVQDASDGGAELRGVARAGGA